MNILKLNNNPLSEVIKIASDCLKSGGILVLPFDTVYGFACSATNDEAIKRIFKLKQRDLSKTIGVAVNSFEKLEMIATPKHTEFIKSKIPGPYTFVLSAKGSNLSKYCYKDSTLAIRIPDSKLIIEIIQESGLVLAQTSANITGKPNISSIQDLKDQFGPQIEDIDLIIDAGILNNPTASEIYDLNGDEPKRIER